MALKRIAHSIEHYPDPREPRRQMRGWSSVNLIGLWQEKVSG